LSASVELVCVDPQRVHEVWPHVAHLIHRALKRTNLNHTGEIDDAVLSGRALLCLAWNGTHIEAVATTSLIATDTDKVCIVTACGGEGMARWLPLANDRRLREARRLRLRPHLRAQGVATRARGLWRETRDFRERLDLMGGTSTTQQQQTSSTTPFGPAQGSLNSILGQLNGQVPNASLTPTETGALDQLKTNAQAGNPFANAIGNAATGLLNGGGAQANDAGISQNFADLKGLLTPFANGSQVGKNPALQGQLDQIASDVSNQVNGQFAAAGRDGSAFNQQALARGIAQGEAPVIAQQFNQDQQNQLNAANALFGAGNSAFGLLNQTNQAANANKQAGVGVGSAALDANNFGANQLLAEEAQRRGIPISALTTLLGAISPVAQAFGTTNGTSNGSSTLSGADQFAKIAGGIASLGNLFSPKK
jgi:hypothetical protein